jgi:hypothetical protein
LSRGNAFSKFGNVSYAKAIANFDAIVSESVLVARNAHIA